MKKKLLFVIPGLNSGGGERSLINLLSQIDYNAYEVDLFLLNHQGMFMEFIPPEVKVLPVPERYRRFALPLPQALLKLLLSGHFTLAYHRLMFSLRSRGAGNDSVKEQHSWKHLSPFFGRLPKEYDTAIGFLEKTSIYFCVEKAVARSKIGWIHIDYDKLGMDPAFDARYFEQLQHLVTVSEECANILVKRFPEQDHKVNVIHNIVSPVLIHQLAMQHPPDDFSKAEDGINILSIGRLHPQKAFELAIEACKMLVDKGCNVRWSVIGDGEERQKLTHLIRRYGLEDHFRLLGLRSNPYPYIRQADLYAQTSRFEGKSIAIDEAKILKKPIVVTNFSTARDQIRHGFDGLIVDMNPAAIAGGIEQLIADHSLRAKLSDNLGQLELGTEDEIHKFYNLLA
ncbi:glycosyltransferase involved in cell wall biosynthesis [Paenibacillus forsythiae]|uniref:Glycosyltransferase involved in cell wall biosynthesis n=1 Tax=Paenibacillus forsythiae TaxID=365616 RepID=A0ABU3HDA8_9BACL|nr:glycosyltransferase [Paenibacillus forsythiae]MDT3428799.1 glycosyltransferase involved in cell wall biosynthesis [Paenibacillus forsythiae]